MKKIILFGLILLIIMIGSTAIEHYEEKTKDTISYTAVKEKTLIGYKEVYIKQDYQVEECDWKIKDNVNISLGCKNKTYSESVIDPTQQGKPIYKYSKEVLKIINKDKEYKFDDYNGIVCGNYLLMVSRKDGGQYLQEVRQDLICDGENIKREALDGIDCWSIYDLKTNNNVGEKKFEHCKI